PSRVFEDLVELPLPGDDLPTHESTLHPDRKWERQLQPPIESDDRRVLHRDSVQGAIAHLGEGVHADDIAERGDLLAPSSRRVAADPDVSDRGVRAHFADAEGFDENVGVEASERSEPVLLRKSQPERHQEQSIRDISLRELSEAVRTAPFFAD